MKTILAILLSFTFLSSCALNNSIRNPTAASNDSSLTLDEGANGLYKFDVDQSIHSIQYVKFIVFLDQNKSPQKIVFQNTNKYLYHSDFLITQDQFKAMNRTQIDAISLYNKPNRQLILGTLFIHFSDSTSGGPALTIPAQSFELVSNDLVEPSHVEKIQGLLFAASPKTFSQRKLGYLASGANRNAILAQKNSLGALGVQVSDFYKAKKKAVYESGWGVGVVKVVSVANLESEVKNGTINRNTILILDSVPREIPPVAGLLVSTPTAKSSHVALLANMFRIPFAYDETFFQKYQKFDQQVVIVSASIQDVFVRPISSETYTMLSFARKISPLDVSLDLSKNQIIPAEDLTEKDLNAYGGKSVRVGLIRKSIPQNSPVATAAIPIFYYWKYISEARTENGTVLKHFIEAKLEQLKLSSNTYADTVILLKDVRDAIRRTPVPADLVNEIKTKLLLLMKGHNKVKLRSSSNVEDGAEFNGAGLYDSEGVWLSNAPAGKENDFEKGLLKVWSSLYTDRGQLARAQFGVDERKVGMAILVNPTIKGELANGVAIWTPSPQSNQGELLFSSFPGEEASVTNPTSTDQPEIVQSYYQEHSKSWSQNEIQKTNLLPVSRPVLSTSEYNELANLLLNVVKSWVGVQPKAGLDFEWKKIEDAGKIKFLVKQVRPMPEHKQEKLADGSSYLLLEDENVEFTSQTPESINAFSLLFCPERIQMHLPNITETTINSGKVSIPSVNVTWFGGTQSVSNVPAKSKIVSNQVDKKNFVVNVDLAKSKIPLQFEFEKPRYDSSKQDFLVTRFAGRVGANASILKMAQAFFPVDEDRNGCAIRSYKDHYPDLKQLPLSTAVFRIKTPQFKIESEATYQPMTPYDKTAFFKPHRTVITGLTPTPIVVDKLGGAVYAPEHHNFEWGFAIDMRTANLNADELESIVKKHGRYLFYSSQLQKAAWLKENGELSSFIDAQSEAPPGG